MFGSWENDWENVKHSYENSIFRMLPNTENRSSDYFPLQNQTPGFHFPYGNSFSPAFILHSEFNLHRAKCSLSLSLKGVCIAMEDFVRVSTVCKSSNVIVRVYKYACWCSWLRGRTWTHKHLQKEHQKLRQGLLAENLINWCPSQITGKKNSHEFGSYLKLFEFFVNWSQPSKATRNYLDH